MSTQDLAQKIVFLLVNKDIQILDYFVIPTNDEITNAVKEEMAKLSNLEIVRIKEFLEELLNACYDHQLTDKNDIKLNIEEKTLFLIKENIIYYLGRLPKPNIALLKKAYFIDVNKYIKLNIVYSTLPSFDEEIESDFVNKLTPGSEYDLMLRSWTMAFFRGIKNPYEYIDNQNDDITKPKEARINRLKVNDEDNPKFLKAMSFRQLDLVVLYLFLQSHNNFNLTEEEKLIIQNTLIDYPLFSDAKKEKMHEYQKLLLKQ